MTDEIIKSNPVYHPPKEEEQPKEKKKFPSNFLVDVFADQQNITLDKLKGGEENDANADAGTS